MSEPEPPPRDRSRSAAVPVAVVALLLLVLGTIGWIAFQRWAAQRESDAIVYFSQKIAVENQQLTDAEFERLLALGDVSDPDLRAGVVRLVAVSAKERGGHPPPPDRVGRAVAFALRKLADPDPQVRKDAVQALHGLGAKEHIEAIRPLASAADPLERKAAQNALEALK